MITLVEPCCGTAALTLHLLGARRQLVPRQGSKWSLRRELAERLRLGRPDRVILSDASPWALVIAAVLSERDRVLHHLRPLVEDGERDPRAVYRTLHGQPVPAGRAELSAQLLWLQRMAYAGKCVRVVDGRWSAPGLNLTSALGVAGTDRFGPVRPLGRALLDVVEAAPQAEVEAIVGLARPRELPGRVVVYLDPPYVGTTGYGPGDLDRSGVVRLAKEWIEAGADVWISEAGPVEELVARGWRTAELGRTGGGDARLLFRARHRGEHLTWRAQPEQLSLWRAA